MSRGTTATPYGNLPAATQNLLQSGTFSQNNLITLTMSGLVAGTKYTFEWWTNNAGLFTTEAGQRTQATGGTGKVTLNNNSNGTGTTGFTNVPGGVGQYDIGTFTADAPSQVVTFTCTNGDFAVLNAFELRTAVPEPATWLGGALLGGLALLGVRRKASRA